MQFRSLTRDMRPIFIAVSAFSFAKISAAEIVG